MPETATQPTNLEEFFLNHVHAFKEAFEHEHEDHPKYTEICSLIDDVIRNIHTAWKENIRSREVETLDRITQDMQRVSNDSVEFFSHYKSLFETKKQEEPELTFPEFINDLVNTNSDFKTQYQQMLAQKKVHEQLVKSFEEIGGSVSERVDYLINAMKEAQHQIKALLEENHIEINHFGLKTLREQLREEIYVRHFKSGYECGMKFKDFFKELHEEFNPDNAQEDDLSISNTQPEEDFLCGIQAIRAQWAEKLGTNSSYTKVFDAVDQFIEQIASVRESNKDATETRLLPRLTRQAQTILDEKNSMSLDTLNKLQKVFLESADRLNQRVEDLISLADLAKKNIKKIISREQLSNNDFCFDACDNFIQKFQVDIVNQYYQRASDAFKQMREHESCEISSSDLSDTSDEETADGESCEKTSSASSEDVNNNDTESLAEKKLLLKSPSDSQARMFSEKKSGKTAANAVDNDEDMDSHVVHKKRSRSPS